ncbi:MAG: rod shape-determining protein MreD [Christensenellales bacterium]
MKIITIAGLIMAALSINTGFLPGIGLRAFAPDMMLILILSLSLRLGHKQGRYVALAGGIVTDLMTSTTLGIYSLVYLLTALAAGIIHKAKIQADRVFVPAAAAFILFMFKDILLLIIALLLGVKLSAGEMLAAASVPSAVATAAGMALLYQPLFMLCNVRYMRARRETDLLDF